MDYTHLAIYNLEWIAATQVFGGPRNEEYTIKF